MGTESEAGGLLGLGGLFGRRGRRSDPDGTEDEGVCLNCEAPLTGRYCSECGQLADDFHRPFGALLVEGIADLFALDGRMANTIPTLLFSPGKATRDYIDGRRARYVPPFRLFLLASLLFFTVLFSFPGAGDSGLQVSADVKPGATEGEASPGSDAGSAEGGPTVDPLVEEKDDDYITVDIFDELDETAPIGRGLMKFETNLERLVNDRDLFMLMLQGWAPRLAFFMLPLTVLGLIAIYPFKKGVYVYDHLIVGLHYQTFHYIIGAVCLVAGMLGSWAVAFWLGAIVYSPIYFYRLVRNVYGGSAWLAVFRTLLMWSYVTVVTITVVALVLATVVYTA